MRSTQHIDKNFEGTKCRQCGDIIEVYSRSGYCRDCYHNRRTKLINLPLVPGVKCWNCGEAAMREYQREQRTCLKCDSCGATQNMPRKAIRGRQRALAMVEAAG